MSVAAVLLWASASFAAATSIDAQLNLTVDSKPVLPLGVFDAYPKEELAKVAALGFNFLEAPFGQVDAAYLDEAQRLNLKVLPWFGGYGPKYLESALAYINTFKGHPAILGWFTIDEPTNFNASKTTLATLYDEFKKADPGHIVFNNFNSLPGDAAFKDTVDVFAIDPYPIISEGKPGGNVSSVATETSLAIKAIDATKPVWNCVQAFGGMDGWKRPPDADEYRILCYLSVIHGAKGLCAYTWRVGGARAMMSDPDLQRGAQTTNAELARLTPPLLKGARRTLVKGAVHAAIIDHEDATYVIVANAGLTPVAPELEVDKDANAEDALSQRPISTINGHLKLSLPAYGVQAARIRWRAKPTNTAITEIGGDCGKEEQNLALAGKVSTNSTLVDREHGVPAYVYFMDKANDGRPNTQWASADPYSLPVMLQVTLPAKRRFTRVVVSYPAAPFYDNWKDVRVEFSDGSALTKTLDDSPVAKSIAFSPRVVDWVRISILSTYTTTHYVGCCEFEIYDDTDPAENVNVQPQTEVK